MNLDAPSLRGLYLLITLGSTALFARADDAAWMQVGDAGNFTKNKQIRMVQEHVWIALSNKSMRVHALFQFRNEGPATNVTMAFPDGIMDYKKRKPGAPQAIKWMKSRVDGRPVKVTRQVYKKVNDFDYDSYTHVWVKSVPFRKGQTRFVSVDYEAAHGDIGDFIQDNYTLKTGATWKGKIGKAVLYLDWSGLRGHMDPQIDMMKRPGYHGDPAEVVETGPRSVKIEFRNIEPDFDIGMTWTPTFWNFFVNGRRAEGMPVDDMRNTFILGNGSDPKIYLRNIHNLLLREEFWQAAEPQEEEPQFTFRRKTVEVKENRLYVNGKQMKLRRGYEGVDESQTAVVYVRDIVKALGGTYRYDSKWDRVYMKF
jgi:hypothetical protein